MLFLITSALIPYHLFPVLDAASETLLSNLCSLTKRIQSQSIQKSRVEAVKTFGKNGWKPSVSDGYLWSKWPSFFSIWNFPLHKPEVETDSTFLETSIHEVSPLTYWGKSRFKSFLTRVEIWPNLGRIKPMSTQISNFFPPSFTLSFTLISKLSLCHCKHSVFKILHCSKVICMWVYFTLSTQNIWT